MPDITTISTALSAVKTATDIAKLIKDSDVSLEQAEVKLKLAELISALADAKIEIADFQELLLEKDKEISKLKAADDLLKKITWDKPYYWVKNDNERDGPFCQNCWDSDEKLIRLQEAGCQGLWHCQKCDKYVKDKSYEDESPTSFYSSSSYDDF